ncbi:hypothetical protein N7523_008804 [Penicillium sp. IBT 18751x]|nr:hypothetical protein N7523_008804 [Penicillium sp. IBT 18751x]
MAPRIFSKLFKSKKKQVSKFTLKEHSPVAIGISDSTCEINGDIFNRWKLPIQPPEYRLRTRCSQKPITQHQSSFFRLPAEIRRLIYRELMGDRRVHIRYLWKEPSPFRPQPKRGGSRWEWWHIVCEQCDCFPEDPDIDYCPDWRAEAGLLQKRPKIGGVEWLRSCQIGYEEASIVLYEANVFAMNKAMDTPFLMSRLLSPRCTSIIKAMDISFPVDICRPGQYENDWMATYEAFFKLFEQSFQSVHQLRLELRVLSWEVLSGYFDDERLQAFLEPFERLSKGREWIRLQICVPYNWHAQFQNIKEKMPRQAEWELTQTIWADPLVMERPMLG